MSSIYLKRCKKVNALLNNRDYESAALISSTPKVIASQDQCYEYVPNSDLFYLTGSTSTSLALLILSGDKNSSYLFSPPADPHEILWEGAEKESAKEIAKRIGAELVETKELFAEIVSKLKTTKQLFFQNIPGTLSNDVATNLINRGTHKRGATVSSFTHLDVILGPLRMIKDKSEIGEIKKAIAITSASLAEALTLASPGTYEEDIRAALDYGFKSRGAIPAFKTIVATGPSASVLHYQSGTRKLKRGDLLLIDCGARYNMYCADITRMYPVGIDPTETQNDLVEIVSSAQDLAISMIKPGVEIKKVQLAVTKELWQGLKTLKVCKLPFEQSVKQKEITKYFPHGIGHSLGIDIHDVWVQYDSKTPVYKEGMVFTVEPGLYFSKPVKKDIPAMGIRLEEDVVVTKKGVQVLSGYVL